MNKRSLLLVIGLFAVYNINLRQVSSHDTYASRFVPISILRDGDLILDEFVPEDMKKQAGPNFFSDYFIYVRGHFYDSHAPVGPLLAVPVYALPAWIGTPDRPELVANLFSKLAASIMTALSAAAVFAASLLLLPALRRQPPRNSRTNDSDSRFALMGALTYGLATSIWSTASLAMWTHTPAILGFALALWALSAGRTGAAGFAGAAAVIARPATAPALALLAVFLAHRVLNTARTGGWASTAARSKKVDFIRFCTAATIVALAGVAYNYWLFGNFVGGAPFRTGYWVHELGATSMFSGSLPVGLAGLTVSPNRGILIYSPVVLIAVAGAVAAWRFPASEPVLLLRYASLAALTILFTYSKFIAWWGGHGYGPRYLTDAMPFVGILLAVGLQRIFGEAPRHRFIQIAAVAVLVYSISIQAIGAFCWPSPWTLNDNPPYRYRLWDWRDTEIEACLRAGPRVDPAAHRLLQRLGF